jgi:hypothetical protein
LTIEIEPNEIWIDNPVNISCYFNENVTTPQTVWAYVTPTNQNLSLNLVNLSYYVREYSPPLLGTYTVFCSNGTSNSNQKMFTVNDLKLNIIESPKSIYTDENLEIKANITKISDSEESISSNVNFKVFINENEVPINEDNTYFMSNRWIITTGSLSNFNPGSYTLHLETSLNLIGKTKTVSDDKSLEIYPALEFYISSINPSNIIGSENVTIKLYAAYHNSSILNSANISLSINNQNIAFKKIADGIIFQAPSLNPGSYNLKVELEYEGMKYSDSKNIEYVISLHGEVVDADGKSVSGKIRLVKEGWSQTILISNGVYSGYVPKGTYTISVTFPKLSATFTNVLISDEVKNLIRYDSFDQAALEGIKTAANFALEFALDFEKLFLEVEYDAKKISDETAIEVYTCSNWNLDARTCTGKWEEVDSTINSIANLAKFELSHLSAFLIGERKGLQIESKLDKAQYYLGEPMELTGIIREDYKPVDDALVRYEIEGVTGETRTNANGVFSIELQAPNKEGTYTLIINASKLLYKPTTTSKEFSVTKKKEITLILPLSAEVVVGLNSSLEISVLNSGQEALHNFRVDITGIPNEWFDFSPKTWNVSAVGEEKKIEIRVNPKSPEKNAYNIMVEVKSDEMEKKDSFVLSVRKPKTGTGETATVTQPKGFQITAHLISNTVNLINSLSIIASGTIIFLLIKRARRKISGSRNYINLLRSIKQEVMRSIRKRERRRNKGKRKIRKR